MDLCIFAAQQLCHRACPLACPGPVPPSLLRRSQWHPQISQCQPTWSHCSTPHAGQPDAHHRCLCVCFFLSSVGKSQFLIICGELHSVLQMQPFIDLHTKTHNRLVEMVERSQLARKTRCDTKTIRKRCIEMLEYVRTTIFLRKTIANICIALLQGKLIVFSPVVPRHLAMGLQA